MARVAICLVVLFCINSVVPTQNFESCPDGSPAPEAVKIDGCEKYPCKFYGGKNVTAKWNFVVTNSTKTLTPKFMVYFSKDTEPFPFPFEQKDACETLSAKCPLSQGEKVTYFLNLPVPDYGLKMSGLTLRIEFLDDNKSIQVCGILPFSLRK